MREEKAMGAPRSLFAGRESKLRCDDCWKFNWHAAEPVAADPAVLRA